jgi:hypothetical protein
MGLFDGYFDPDQFRDSGGLLGRLRSLQQEQGQYLPGTGFDRASSVAQAPAALSMPSPMLLNKVQPSAVPPMGIQDLKSQYAALLPILGDHNAMIATVNPEMGKTLIAQALANQQQPGNLGDAMSAGYEQPAVSDASPDPVRPGSQYAQGAMGLCAAGPAGCAVGAGLTAGQAILGGAVLGGGLGAIILKSQDNSSDSGDKPASTPIGRRGNPIDVKRGTNQPTTIGGRVYTGHAADQMQGRGITPSAVEETIQNGQTSPGNAPGETEHIGTNGVKVVTGADGQVITVITVER